MAVYVDPLFRVSPDVYRDKQARRVGEKNGHLWCHMMADSDAELHAAAMRIGMLPEWHQASPPHGVSHYDLTPKRREAAVKHGAIEVHAGWRPGRHLVKRTLFQESN